MNLTSFLSILVFPPCVALSRGGIVAIALQWVMGVMAICFMWWGLPILALLVHLVMMIDAAMLWHDEKLAEEELRRMAGVVVLEHSKKGEEGDDDE